MDYVLPDLIESDLKILFIGINPGIRSAEVGHHFAGRSNRFWKFLFESGLTPVKYDAFHDYELLNLGYGITNIAPRTTATAAELTPAELKEGALVLLDKIRQSKPRIAAYLGKVVYRYLSGRKNFDWGRQEPTLVAGVIDFVLPNPSGLNRIPLPEQLKMYQELERTREKFCY